MTDVTLYCPACHLNFMCEMGQWLAGSAICPNCELPDADPHSHFEDEASDDG